MTPQPTTATGTHQTQHSNRIWLGWWVLAGIGALIAVAIVGVALWASARSGREIDPNQILLALIALISALAALIVPKLNAVGKNTSQTAEHVANSHTTNLRDDLDKVLRIVTVIDARTVRLEVVQDNQGRDIFGLREEVGQLRQVEREQWAAIESTDRRQRQRDTPS